MNEKARLTFAGLKQLTDARDHDAIRSRSADINRMLAEQCMEWHLGADDAGRAQWYSYIGTDSPIERWQGSVSSWSPWSSLEQTSACTSALACRGWMPTGGKNADYLGVPCWYFKFERPNPEGVDLVYAVCDDRVEAEALACALAALWDKENGGAS